MQRKIKKVEVIAVLLNIVVCVLAVLLLAAFCFWIVMGRQTDVDDSTSQTIKRILDVVIIALAAFLIVCSVKLYNRAVVDDMPIERVPKVEDFELPELEEEIPNPLNRN